MKAEDFLKELSNIKFDTDNYDYRIGQSVGEMEMYGKTDEKAVALHMMHMLSDEYEDGWSVVACSGNVEKSSVICYYVVRRRKED